MSAPVSLAGRAFLRDPGAVAVLAALEAAGPGSTRFVGG